MGLDIPNVARRETGLVQRGADYRLLRRSIRCGEAAGGTILVDRRAADHLFEEIRAQGCAPVSDLYLNGISAVAAPVRNADGGVPVVITALGPSGAFDPSPGGEIAGAVRQAAAAVSQRLGHEGW